MQTKHVLASLALAVAFISPLAYAEANTGSLSIQSLSPNTTIAPGAQVTMVMAPSGFTGTVSYSILDSLSGSSISSSGFSANTLTWTPSINDTGSHNLTITATDPNGNSAVAYQQLTVMGSPTLTIQSVSPNTTVVMGQTVTFSAVASGFSAPSFSLTDSFGNTSLNTTAISSNGAFSWKPLPQDAGTHTITVFAYDSVGNSANKAQTITVNSAANLTIQSLLPGVSAQYGQTVSFTVTQTGFTNPAYFVTDSYTGSTITNGNISATGVFTWVPLSGEVGSHTITVRAVDSLGNVATTPVTVVVTAPTPTTTTTATVTTTTTSSSSLSPTQVAAIVSLIQSFGADAATIAKVTAALTGQTVVTTGSATSGYKFYNALNVGSEGTDVTELQKRLIAKGLLSGSATGYYGSLTQAAVKKYQAQKGLAQLGNVGPGTRAALNAE